MSQEYDFQLVRYGLTYYKAETFRNSLQMRQFMVPIEYGLRLASFGSSGKVQFLR
jgi:hypothetical protein